jgi:hypothetical protein
MRRYLSFYFYVERITSTTKIPYLFTCELVRGWMEEISYLSALLAVPVILGSEEGRAGGKIKTTGDGGYS